MKLYSNEGYGKRHTFYSNVASVAMMAGFTLMLGWMVVCAVWIMMTGNENALAAMLLVLFPFGGFAGVWGWADQKASAAFEDHLAALKAKQG